MGENGLVCAVNMYERGVNAAHSQPEQRWQGNPDDKRGSKALHNTARGFWGCVMPPCTPTTL
jgi:hypothetical protein